MTTKKSSMNKNNWQQFRIVIWLSSLAWVGVAAAISQPGDAKAIVGGHLSATATYVCYRTDRRSKQEDALNIGRPTAIFVNSNPPQWHLLPMR